MAVVTYFLLICLSTIFGVDLRIKYYYILSAVAVIFLHLHN